MTSRSRPRGPREVDPRAHAAHGADARRRRAGHRRLPARRRGPVARRAGAAALRQERPLLLDAVHRPPLHRPRLRLPAPGRARQVPLRRRDRTPSCTRSTTATTRSSGSRRQPWSNGAVGMWGDSYYGFTQWAAVASGHPALKAIVPRVTVADLFDWLTGVTPLYGAHYLAEYWTDNDTHHWTPDWIAPAAERAVRPCVRGHRHPLAGLRPAAGRGARPAAAWICTPTATRSTRLRIPTLHGVGWFDNITPPHMRDYERLVRRPGDGALPVPARRIDRPRELPVRGGADHRGGGPRAHDDALERVLPRYLAPALDFFDAFLAGRTDPDAVPRVRWHLPDVGWRESPSWPPPGASRAARCTRPRRASLAASAGPATAASAGCTTPTISSPPRSPTRSRSSRVPGRERGGRPARRAGVHRPAAGRRR